MPLTGPVSYLPVADQFLEHWSRVESSLGDDASLNLGHGIDRDAVLEVRSRLAAALESVTKTRIVRETERRDLVELDALVARLLGLFNRQVLAPGAEARTADEAAKIWFEREKAGEKILLDGVFTRMDFVTDCSAWKLVSSALTAAEKALSSARGARDGAQDQLHAFLELYAERVAELFPRDHELRESLPPLMLGRGQVPEAVDISARWQETSAIIAWPESDEPDLDRYEVRAMAGETYEAEDETLVESVACGERLSIATTFALEEKGAVATFRVYVVLRSGHERGSRPLTVVRS